MMQNSQISIKQKLSEEPFFRLALSLSVLTTFIALALYGYLGTFSRYGSDDYCLSAFFVQDNIFSLAHMREFEAFLQQFHFPFPMISAIVSAYAQAIAGLLFIAGWKTRWAALLMVINFVIALIMVHRGQSFEQMTTVLFMIVVSLSLLLTGAGRYSLDRE